MARPKIALVTEYVKCRTWGHEWDTFQPFTRYRENGANSTLVSLRCARCTTERYDYVGTTGEVEGRQYLYPEGYRYAADEKPTIGALRLELITRLHHQ